MAADQPMLDVCPKQWTVYWLYDDECLEPRLHGYVGRTSNLKTRLKNHKRKWPNGFRLRILFQGTKMECIKYEAELRPDFYIGWNISPGGGTNRRLNYRHSPETCAKMSESAKLRDPPSEETREKLRFTSTGRTNQGRVGQQKSEEEKAKISSGHKDKKFSEEHRRKIGLAKLGNKNRLGAVLSEETKERIRMKKIGVPIHSEEEKKKRSDRWKGNTLTKGKPWSVARRLAHLQRQQKEA